MSKIFCLIRASRLENESSFLLPACSLDRHTRLSRVKGSSVLPIFLAILWSDSICAHLLIDPFLAGGYQHKPKAGALH